MRAVGFTLVTKLTTSTVQFQSFGLAAVLSVLVGGPGLGG